MGQVSQLFADAEVARLVERGFGAERSSFLQVLLDLGLLVVQVEVGAGPARDDLGPEGAGSRVLAAQAVGAHGIPQDGDQVIPQVLAVLLV